MVMKQLVASLQISALWRWRKGLGDHQEWKEGEGKAEDRGEEQVRRRERNKQGEEKTQEKKGTSADILQMVGSFSVMRL